MEYEYAVYERSNFKTWHKSGGWYNTLVHAESVYERRIVARKLSRRDTSGVRLVKRPRNPEEREIMPSMITNGYGYLTVRKIEGEFNSGPGKTVSIKTGTDAAELTRWEAFQLIEQVAVLSGLGALVNEATGEITILRPESPAVMKRKDELSKEYYGLQFSILIEKNKAIIEHIVSLEKKLGVLG